jgi:hypothetical protein
LVMISAFHPRQVSLGFSHPMLVYRPVITGVSHTLDK